MGAKIKNNAFGTILNSISASDVSITLSTGNGANFPALGAGDYFYATLIDTANNLEIIKVTAVVGDVLTVVRAQDNTTAKAYLAGDRLEIRMTAALFSEKLDATAGNASQLHITDYVDYAPTPGAAGRMQWNDTDGTLDLGLKGGNVTLQVGQEQVQRVRNITGATISDGQVVYVDGSTGVHLDVKLAKADSEATSSKTLAVVTESIGNGQTGFATVMGLVRNLNTSGFLEGDALWLSAATAGAITATRPTQPNHGVFIGWCIRSHAMEGSIYVHIQNGYELDELHDVLFGAKLAGQTLIYDSVNGVWKNARLTAGSNITITNTDGNITIASTAGNTGTVTSVAVAVPTGLEVSGSPVTTTGTITIQYQAGYSIPTTTKQTEWDTAYGWGNHASAGYLDSADIGVSVQAYDADLTAIAGLAGTTGLLRKTAANTWALDTTAYTTNTGTVTSVGLTAPTGLSVSGSPVTSSGTLTLSYSAGYSIPTTAKQGNWDTAYSWGNHASAGYTTPSNTQTLTNKTVNLANNTITGTKAQFDTACSDGSFLYTDAIGSTVQAYDAQLDDIAGLTPTDNGVIIGNGANFVIESGATLRTSLGLVIGTDVQAYDGDLAAIAALAGTSGLLRKTAANTWSLDTASYLSGNQSITLSGDASGTGSTAITVTLSNSGVSAGTYRSVTVDAKGRVTAGTNPTTLAGYGITDAAPLSHVGSGGGAHANATTSDSGFMSSADKTKLDGVAAGATANVGTVTSVGLTAPTGLSVSNSPITSNGNINITFTAGYSIPTTANQTNWNSAYSWGNHATAGYLDSADIGTTVQAYDADTAKLDVAQSWTAQQTFKELKDTVYTITDGAAFEIDPANGSIQTITLGANRTPAATNFEAGQVVLLGIDDGTSYTITWTTVAVTWVKAGGSASAPTLASSGFTWVLLWKVGTTIYGLEVGKP